MKILFITFIALYSINSFGQVPYKVSPEKVDFGTLSIDTVKKSFYYNWDVTEKKNIWIINTGNEPIVISKGFWGGDCCPMDHPKVPILVGDSGIVTLYCKAFGYEKEFNKTIILKTNVGVISIPFRVKYKFMPHLTEISQCSFEISRNGNYPDLYVYHDSIVEFTVKNLSSSETKLVGFKSDSLIELKNDTIIIGPNKSVTLKANTIYPNLDKHYERFVIIRSHIYFTAINDQYSESFTIDITTNYYK
jgi:hypothetical protein